MSEEVLPEPEERVVHTLSPEERRQDALRHRPHLRARVLSEVGPGTRAFEIGKRVLIGAYNDGFIHAGNLAYMAILAIFPFFILGAAIFSLVGEEADRAASIDAILYALPPLVGNVIEPVARSVVQDRNGWFLWLGALFGLWTVSSLIETIRDILRRAYGTKAVHAFWKYRLFSAGVIFGAVVLLMISLLAQVLIGTAQEVIDAYLPRLNDVIGALRLSRIVPALGLFGSLYLLFYTLTPKAYRSRRYPKWPGALATAGWWVAVTVALPPAIRSFFSYDATYGSLAGIMIALFFFYLVGLGMVVGAELNAALAETPEEAENRIGQADNRARHAAAAARELKRMQEEGIG
ncbi:MULTISPECIES: YihY/virulence factor BrkB family protein [Bacteria]|uniref:YihY/virulence factor BrkB family protein n=1 Tax=Bacteria TaxID=2 RepID=UPI0010409B86|nr:MULTISPECIES: YihY/virulence factor BrkB family protein [Bacteria]QDM40999.1 YihY/virulence factor BrkB family protein [Altererythrobacter sp. TH136]TCJ40210.1 YihY/virulence factor BrkB family protein [Parafrankia sp. BMG5.11]